MTVWRVVIPVHVPPHGCVDRFTSSPAQYSLTLFRNLSNEAVVDSGVCRVVDEEVEVQLPSDANAKLAMINMRKM